jgi:hypothetical protein
MLPSQNLETFRPRLLIILVVTIALLISVIFLDPAIAARKPFVPDHGEPILSGIIKGEAWLAASAESKNAFCNEAFAAFRGSPSQSYIISSNVQSLTPAGLCDRMDQYFSIEENLDVRIGAAAAIAPLLFADTPLGTKYPK